MPPGRVIRAINGIDRSSVKSYDQDSSTVGLLAAILDAILDLTAFRYSNFGRFLVCYSPPQTVPETVKKTSASNFLGVRPYFVVYLPDYMQFPYIGLQHCISHAIGIVYVAAKATYIRLLFGKMGVFRP